MQPYFVLLVLYVVFSPAPGEHTSNPDDHSEGKDSHSEEDSVVSEDSAQCEEYENLLHDILPKDYMDDPVRDLRISYLEINFDSVPDEKYYLTVLKAKDAYERGLIKSAVTRALKSHSKGIKTEIYLTAPDYFENRLISHQDVSKAKEYFRKRLENDCGSQSRDSVPESDSSPGDKGEETMVQRVERKCLKTDQIRDFERQMKKVDVRLKPGPIYYKLVLRINRAVHCKQLTPIEGTLMAGASGVKTEEYITEDGHGRVSLPSTKGKEEARAYFKERKKKSQAVHETELSDSSSGEGRNNNHHKAAAAGAGATSDESDDKQLITAPVPVQHPGDSDRWRTVPLDPVKHQIGAPAQTKFQVEASLNKWTSFNNQQN